jgi:perosamine synthetase
MTRERDRPAMQPTMAPIPWAQPRLWGAEEQYVCEALRSTWISGGPFVERLEERIARFCGVDHAVAASNGTTALHMAYLALGIGAGDEVVVPGFAFMAAANVALHVGAQPVFAEVDPETWCVTAAGVEACLTPRTRLIVPVHTYGNLCDMDDILALARSRGIAVLEDAAEAFASRYKGRPAGAIAPIGTFSFQATKTITTGEGGMVVTNDQALTERMRLYRSHGMPRRRYWHEVAGHNFRLTNMQAALGCAQMESLDQILAQRKRVHQQYCDRLFDVPGLALQRFTAGVEPVLWAMAVRLDDDAYPQGRDGVIAQLQDRGIETRPGFHAASLMPLYGTSPLPICERLSRQVLSPPTFPGLQEEQIERVCESLGSLRR